MLIRIITWLSKNGLSTRQMSLDPTIKHTLSLGPSFYGLLGCSSMEEAQMICLHLELMVQLRSL